MGAEVIFASKRDAAVEFDGEIPRCPAGRVVCLIRNRRKPDNELNSLALLVGANSLKVPVIRCLVSPIQCRQVSEMDSRLSQAIRLYYTDDIEEETLRSLPIQFDDAPPEPSAPGASPGTMRPPDPPRRQLSAQAPTRRVGPEVCSERTNVKVSPYRFPCALNGVCGRLCSRLFNKSRAKALKRASFRP